MWQETGFHTMRKSALKWYHSNISVGVWKSWVVNDRPGHDCLQLCSIQCHLPSVGKNVDMMLYLLRGSKTCLTSSKLCVLVFLVRTNFCNRFNVPMDSALSSGSVHWQKTEYVKSIQTLQINTKGNMVLILRMRKTQIQRINHLHNALKVRHFLAWTNRYKKGKSQITRDIKLRSVFILPFTYYFSLIPHYYLILNSRLVPENILIYVSTTSSRSSLDMHRNPRCGELLHLNVYGSVFWNTDVFLYSRPYFLS